MHLTAMLGRGVILTRFNRDQYLISNLLCFIGLLEPASRGIVERSHLLCLCMLHRHVNTDILTVLARLISF